MSSAQPTPEPIDDYLDTLLPALRGTPRDIRRTLAECESHLREDAQHRAASGADPHDAEVATVTAFGAVRDVAAAFNAAHRPAATRALLAAGVLQAWWLGAVGLVAVGVSGLLAWVWSAVTGPVAAFADAPGVHLDPVTCAHFLAVQPTANTCAVAAVLEGRNDALLQRGAAGILGLALLVGARWWRRRTRPAAFDLSTAGDLVAATVFGVAAVSLTGYAIDRATLGSGSGQWFSAGLAAAVPAGAFLLRWARTVVSTGDGWSRTPRGVQARG